MLTFCNSKAKVGLYKRCCQPVNDPEALNSKALQRKFSSWGQLMDQPIAAAFESPILNQPIS